MYAGHAALALLAKGKRPRIPIAVLVPVAFAPDWIEWVLQGFGIEYRMWSHSLVSVAIGATVLAGLYWLATRAGTDALVVALTYCSHWPADYITGFKPTWPGGPWVGLLLYRNPLTDVVLECALIVACWFVYRASLPAVSRRRAIAFLVPLGLVGMQIGFAAMQSPNLG